MKITVHFALISAILSALAAQPLSARNSILDITTATQNTISDHKQAIATIGAVTLVGLGAYWWFNSRQVKPTSPVNPVLNEPAIETQNNVQNTKSDEAKKLSFIVKLSKPDKFLFNAKNEPISVGACIAQPEAQQPKNYVVPNEPVPLLPLRSMDSVILLSESDKHEVPVSLNDNNAPFVAQAINKDALENYLSNPAHYYCTKNRDEVYSHVHRGQTTMRDILSGKLTMEQKPFELEVTHADRHAHLNNIISACWYMYSVALTKGQMFEEGSFVVHDDGKLYDYLLQYVKNVNPDHWNSCIAHSANPYGYCRHSTHLHKYQELGHHHYGIDIREGDTLNGWDYWVPFSKQQKAHLPTGKKHILFGKIDEHRTFIKLENDGLYRYDGLIAHAFGAVTSTARKLGIGTNDGPMFRKEHMPKEVLMRIKQLLKEYDINAQIPKTIAEIVQLCKQHNLLTPFLNELREKFDHIEERHGNEVILKQNELLLPLPDKFI